MSDDKSNVADKAGEIARNIWLAGVGAYGKAVEDAQDRLERAGVEPPKLFKDLVKAGTALEREARETAERHRSSLSSVEERINRVRDNFGVHRLGLGDDLQGLHRKVDELTARLDQLSKALEAQGVIDLNPPKKKATRKAPAKKKATAKKPAAKKAAAKKAPAKKAATKTAIQGKASTRRATAKKAAAPKKRSAARSKRAAKPKR